MVRMAKDDGWWEGWEGLNGEFKQNDEVSPVEESVDESTTEPEGNVTRVEPVVTFSMREAARYAGISFRTLKSALLDGKIKYRVIEDRVLITKDAMDEWLAGTDWPGYGNGLGTRKEKVKKKENF